MSKHSSIASIAVANGERISLSAQRKLTIIPPSSFEKQRNDNRAVEAQEQQDTRVQRGDRPPYLDLRFFRGRWPEEEACSIDFYRGKNFARRGVPRSVDPRFSR